jgi:CRP-like cAMP-binding protein
LQPEEVLVEQGEPGTTVFLVLDGVLSVEVDGESVAEVAPGAIVGERAVVEGGIRTATLRAVTNARVAEADPEQFESSDLEALAAGHRREDAPN